MLYKVRQADRYYYNFDMERKKNKVNIPRSYGLLEKLLKEVNYDPAVMRYWAEQLSPYQIDGATEKMRVSRLFFEDHGKTLAGICGCSKLIFDHQRVTIVKNCCRDFLITHGLMFHAGIYGDISATALARLLKSAFDIPAFNENTLADRLRHYSRANGYGIKW